MNDQAIKYAAYYLIDAGKNADDISKELKISKKKVENILKDKPAPEIKPIGPKDLMITETSAKKTKNVAIMTEAASMMIDSKKNSLTANTDSVRMTSNNIYRPLDK